MIEEARDMLLKEIKKMIAAEVGEISLVKELSEAEVTGILSPKQKALTEKFKTYHLNLEWKQYVPDDCSNVFFYGGAIATISNDDSSIFGNTGSC